MKQEQYHKRRRCDQCGGAGRWTDNGLCEDCDKQAKEIFMRKCERLIAKEVAKP